MIWNIQLISRHCWIKADFKPNSRNESNALWQHRTAVIWRPWLALQTEVCLQNTSIAHFNPWFCCVFPAAYHCRLSASYKLISKRWTPSPGGELEFNLTDDRQQYCSFENLAHQSTIRYRGGRFCDRWLCVGWLRGRSEAMGPWPTSNKTKPATKAPNVIWNTIFSLHREKQFQSKGSQFG